MQKDSTTLSDVLIVCGQGTYEKGNYYTEYPDRDVYLLHAIRVKRIVLKFNYSHVVCSGGFTRSETKTRVSEAKSFKAMWNDTDSWPSLDKNNFFWDDKSLDSAENVYLGLMAARAGLGKIPIRRIGVFAAWKFKKVRFNSLARELGIINRFYFHGLAWANEANAGERALQGENNQMKNIIDTNDHLLLSDEWKGKRCGRYQGPGEENSLPDYANRLNGLREQFSQFFETLDEIRLYGMKDALRIQLQGAFQDEVVQPFS